MISSHECVSLLSVVNLWCGSIQVFASLLVHVSNSNHFNKFINDLAEIQSQSHCGNEWTMPRVIFNASIDHFSFHISMCLFIMFIRARNRWMCIIVVYSFTRTRSNWKHQINKNVPQIDKHVIICIYLECTAYSIECWMLNAWRTNWIVSMPNAHTYRQRNILFFVYFE